MTDGDYGDDCVDDDVMAINHHRLLCKIPLACIVHQMMDYCWLKDKMPPKQYNGDDDYGDADDDSDAGDDDGDELLAVKR